MWAETVEHDVGCCDGDRGMCSRGMAVLCSSAMVLRARVFRRRAVCSRRRNELGGEDFQLIPAAGTNGTVVCIVPAAEMSWGVVGQLLVS